MRPNIFVRADYAMLCAEVGGFVHHTSVCALGGQGWSGSG